MDPVDMARSLVSAFVASSSLLALAPGCLERKIVSLEPLTTNVVVDVVRNPVIDKIDILVVVDNSASMADKQQILREAVPTMLTRLVRPDCVDEARTMRQRAAEDGSCPDGLAPEFRPVRDIHVGAITSSLGGHGSSFCRSTEQEQFPKDGGHAHTDDRALLLPRVRTKPEFSPNGEVPVGDDPLGFLTWNPAPGGEAAALTSLTNSFQRHVIAANEDGCGFEAQLESWYRFLIDPSPPKRLELVDGSAFAADDDGDGLPDVDEEILAQRRGFLRPDSLVAIVLLTDENDCSAIDGDPRYPLGDLGWAVGREGPIPPATSACAINPNDPCCYSCAGSPPAECTNEAYRNECPSLIAAEEAKPESEKTDDRANLRCFAHQKRFGFDVLYPTSRYVEGLRSERVVDRRTGELVDNPLLVNGTTRRPTDLVYFAGIVGVPWQDLADEESLRDPSRLTYLKASALSETNVLTSSGAMVSRWDLLLGSRGRPASAPECFGENPHPDCLVARVASDGITSCVDAPSDARCLPRPPADPFMIESVEPRPLGATHPLTGDAVLAPDAATRNAINGREWNAGAEPNGDLQYACTFDLRPFGAEEPCSGGNCDCGADGSNTALCDGDTQTHAKAYPSTRILEVLRDIGDSAIVASICPKVSDRDSLSYGYDPAMDALIDRLVPQLAGSCLTRKLEVTKDRVPCRVIETVPAGGGCELPGREPVEAVDPVVEAVRWELGKRGVCGGDGRPACDTFDLCELEQLAGADLTECQNEPTYGGTASGYCYIDPEQGYGSPRLVAQCSGGERRQLRFVDHLPDDEVRVPRKEALTVVACTAARSTED